METNVTTTITALTTTGSSPGKRSGIGPKWTLEGGDKTDNGMCDEFLMDEENKARKRAHHNALYLLIVNGYSACIVFILFLISLESIISLGLSIGLTIAIYHRTESNDTFDGSTMNWVMLSFVVITPISVVIRLAFNRREQALIAIANIRTTFFELYIAHACWDWAIVGKSNVGRHASHVNWLDHSDQVLHEMIGISRELTRWLTLPTASRARHKATHRGRKECKEICSIGVPLYDSIVERFGRLADLCEVLKYEGLPPNEATRVRQWERFVFLQVESLRIIKNYRTPQALRSFARLFSIFMPPFYAPYYAQLARDLDSLGMAIAFSCVTSIALTALFETVSQMEE
jgi:hypothetical protein